MRKATLTHQIPEISVTTPRLSKDLTNLTEILTSIINTSSPDPQKNLLNTPLDLDQSLLSSRRKSSILKTLRSPLTFQKKLAPNTPKKEANSLFTKENDEMKLSPNINEHLKKRNITFDHQITKENNHFTSFTKENNHFTSFTKENNHFTSFTKENNLFKKEPDPLTKGKTQFPKEIPLEKTKELTKNKKIIYKRTCSTIDLDTSSQELFSKGPNQKAHKEITIKTLKVIKGFSF